MKNADPLRNKQTLRFSKIIYAWGGGRMPNVPINKVIVVCYYLSLVINYYYIPHDMYFNVLIIQ